MHTMIKGFHATSTEIKGARRLINFDDGIYKIGRTTFEKTGNVFKVSKNWSDDWGRMRKETVVFSID